MPDVQVSDLNRKVPKQARAQRTVETILEATAQILAEVGSERLTTNYLAERAGFSVGTIYQYFPNREAIVLALVARQREAVGRRIQTLLAESVDESAEGRIRGIIHVLHDAFNVHRMPDRRLVEALLRMAVAQGVPAPPDIVARSLFQIWSTQLDTAPDTPNESELFVLTSALFEVLRQAALQASPLLGTPDFEDALMRVVIGFLRGRH